MYNRRPQAVAGLRVPGRPQGPPMPQPPSLQPRISQTPVLPPVKRFAPGSMPAQSGEHKAPEESEEGTTSSDESSSDESSGNGSARPSAPQPMKNTPVAANPPKEAPKAKEREAESEEKSEDDDPTPRTRRLLFQQPATKPVHNEIGSDVVPKSGSPMPVPVATPAVSAHEQAHEKTNSNYNIVRLFDRTHMLECQVVALQKQVAELQQQVSSVHTCSTDQDLPQVAKQVHALTSAVLEIRSELASMKRDSPPPPPSSSELYKFAPVEPASHAKKRSASMGDALTPRKKHRKADAVPSVPLAD